MFKDIGVVCFLFFLFRRNDWGATFFSFFFLSWAEKWLIDFRSFFVFFPSCVYFISSSFYTYDEYMMTKRFLRNLIKVIDSNRELHIYSFYCLLIRQKSEILMRYKYNRLVNRCHSYPLCCNDSQRDYLQLKVDHEWFVWQMQLVLIQMSLDIFMSLYWFVYNHK